MQVSRTVKAFSVGVIVVGALTLAGVSPAAAAQTDCPSQDFCLWNPTLWSGAPTVYKGAYNINKGYFAVSPDITSSGDNRRGIGQQYCGYQEGLDGSGGPALIQVANWPINTALSLAGHANNTIVEINYSNDCP